MSTTASFPSASGASRAVTMPVEFFAGLRDAVRASEAGSAVLAVDAIRDAGYHAGHALYDDFAQWLTQRGEAGPTELADERFPTLFEAFFQAHGWGTVALSPLSEAVLMLDAHDTYF